MTPLVLLLATAVAALPDSAAPEGTPAVEVQAQEPLRPALAAALQHQMPQLELRPGARPGSEDRVVVVRPEGSEAAELEVRSADGVLLLSRRVPADDGLAASCADIVDRFLVETHWGGLVADPETGVAPSSAAPEGTPKGPQPAVAAGLGGVVTRGLDGGVGAAGPELSLWVRGPRVAWGLRAAWGFIPDREVSATDPQLDPQRRGTMHPGSASLAGSAGLCFGERAFGCVAVLGGATATWARTDGSDLYRQRSLFSLQPTLGAAVSGGIGNLPLGLQLQAEVGGDARLGAARFSVEGAGDLRVPAVEIGLSLRLLRKFL